MRPFSYATRVVTSGHVTKIWWSHIQSAIAENPIRYTQTSLALFYRTGITAAGSFTLRE